MDKKKKILEIMRKETLAVISTVSKNGKPQSAVVEFSETDSLELIFDTFNSARKYRNLQSNKSVAAVIGWDENITVQYEGSAKELDGKELEQAKQTHNRKLPDAAKFSSLPDIRFFKIKPKWIRYSNLNSDPWEVFELKF